MTAPTVSRLHFCFSTSSPAPQSGFSTSDNYVDIINIQIILIKNMPLNDLHDFNADRRLVENFFKGLQTGKK